MFWKKSELKNKLREMQENVTYYRESAIKTREFSDTQIDEKKAWQSRHDKLLVEFKKLKADFDGLTAAHVKAHEYNQSMERACRNLEEALSNHVRAAEFRSATIRRLKYQIANPGINPGPTLTPLLPSEGGTPFTF